MAQGLNVAAAAAKSLQSGPTLRSHRRQPTRLLCSWDSPGKNTGVGCHFLLQCMHACSVAWVVSDSVQPHRHQQARLPCLSPAPTACSNSCPSSQWCHPTISSSVVPFSSCLQSFPSSGSFPMSQFFSSDDQSIGPSASASVLPINIQDWFPLGLTGLISLQSKGFSTRVVSKPLFKSINSSVLSFLYSPTVISIHDYWKIIALTRQIFVGKVMSLLLIMLSSLVIAFLPRSKCLLISWLQSLSAVILEPRKIKSVSFHCFPIY